MDGLYIYETEASSPPAAPSTAQADPALEALKKKYGQQNYNPLCHKSGLQALSTTLDDGTRVIFAKNKQGDYVEVFREPLDPNGKQYYADNFFHRQITVDNKIIYCYPRNGGRAEALLLDPEKPNNVRSIASDPNHDIRHVLLDDKNELIAYSYLDTSNLCVKWQSPNRQADFDKLSQYLQNATKNNQLSLEMIRVEQSPEHGETWTTIASSATQPRIKHYLKRDSATGEFSELKAAEQPQKLKTEELSPAKVISLKGHEGTPVSAMLFAAQGKQDTKNSPVIVMTHGGPHSSISNNFDGIMEAIQILCSQGYTVLALNHRGSSDHGNKFATDIGGGNQALAAHDTIAATRDAISQGLIRPENISLFGHSFGGYTNTKVAEIEANGTQKTFKKIIASAPIVDLTADPKFIKEHAPLNIGTHLRTQAWTGSEVAIKPIITTAMMFIVGQQNHGDMGSEAQLDALTAKLPNTTPYHYLKLEGVGHSPFRKQDLTKYWQSIFEFLNDKNPQQKTETHPASTTNNPVTMLVFVQDLLE